MAKSKIPKSLASNVNALNQWTNLSTSYQNRLSVTPDSVSIIRKGNVAHISIAYPAVSVNNDTQLGVLPAAVKSSALSIFNVVNRTSGALINGTVWVNGNENAIRYYGTAITNTRIAINGVMSLDTN